MGSPNLSQLRIIHCQKMLRSSLSLCFLLTLGLVNQSESTITLGALAIPTITFTSGTATTLAALGLIKLKAAKILALSRNKRQAEEGNLVQIQEEILWTAVRKMEDNQKCVQRFICEAATGKLVTQDFSSVIKNLVSSSVEESISPKKIYARAAKRGAGHRKIEKCQADFICNFTGEQLYKQLNLF